MNTPEQRAAERIQTVVANDQCKLAATNYLSSIIAAEFADERKAAKGLAKAAAYVMEMSCDEDHSKKLREALSKSESYNL